ncbi:hypothetical protein BJX76DRAFT_365793 [Aspergillus varians]
MSAIKRRACVACTAAKAKCTPQAANLCQRCARLGKSCTYLDLPQTKRRHRAAAPSRVQVLEKKVDQLMSQLAALTGQNGQTSPPDTSNHPPANNSGSSRDPEAELDSTDLDIDALLDAAKDPSHGVDPPTSSALEGQPSIVDRGLLSAAEAERLVTSFQVDLVAKFPFVVLAHGETAARLRAREPFLFLCVVAATMGSAHPLRKTVVEEIMKHVTRRVVARSERNLELLRGLLIHSAWYSSPAERYHPRLLLLIQFCVSILYDLGLHRKKPSPSLDEQRALLGTYWLSVGVCGTLGRPVVMKHDGRTDECIESIASSTEYLSDRWISPFIHLHSGKALIQVTRGSLQRQFDSVRGYVEKGLSNYPPSTVNAIRTEINYAEMRLDELSLRDELWIAESTNAIRTTMLMGIIQRSKALIHTITNLPTSEIAHMTITTSAHICAAVGYLPTAVMALLNLITSIGPSPTDSTSAMAMEDSAAQVQAVIEAAEYPTLVTELATALETRLEGMSAADKETDVVGSICSKMRMLARCYPYQIRAIVGVAPALSQDAHVRQDVTSTSVMGVQSSLNEIAMTPQVWPSIYGPGDLGDIFPGDDIQWDSLLSDFTGFG